MRKIINKFFFILTVLALELVTMTCDKTNPSGPTNDPPTASFSYTIYMNLVQFTDQSDDEDGQVTSWHWSFGNGVTSDEQNPSHQYISSGIYVVVLTVTDNQSAKDSTSQNIVVPNQPPTASFAYSTNGGIVHYTDQSTDPDGEIVSWHWDFGDAATSVDQNPRHEYAISGIYETILVVTDNHGATDTTSQDVNVTTDFIIYSDAGIPSDAEIWTWSGEDWGGPAGSFNANYTGEPPPEGSKCFRTKSGSNWNSSRNYAGWGVFLIKPADHTVDLSSYLILKFWIKTAENLKVEIQQINRSGSKFKVYINNYGWNGVNEWQEITIPANAFNADYTRIFSPFMITVEEGNRTFYIDDVRWTY